MKTEIVSMLRHTFNGFENSNMDNNIHPLIIREGRLNRGHVEMLNAVCDKFKTSYFIEAKENFIQIEIKTYYY